MVAGMWVPVIVSFIAGLVAYWRRFLTLPAAIAAASLGAIVLIFGGWEWGAATAVLFFITVMLSQRQDRLETVESNFSRVPRNLKQVLANGLLLGVLAVLYSTGGNAQSVVAAYLGSLGAVAGDTWASAAAQFSSGDPRLLTSRRRVVAGTPGAITNVGIALTALAGFLGSVLYLSMSAVLGGATAFGTIDAVLCAAAVIGALAGSLFDSYLGAACQGLYTDADDRLTDLAVADNGHANTYVRGWRWLNNDLVNFSNAIAGGTAAYLVWLAASWLKFV